MDKPQEISEAHYVQLLKRYKRNHDELHFSAAPCPCGARTRTKDRMYALNRHDAGRVVIYHLLRISCDLVKDWKCPETIAVCLVHDKRNNKFYRHRHLVGECWFKLYPKEETD